MQNGLIIDNANRMIPNDQKNANSKVFLVDCVPYYGKRREWYYTITNRHIYKGRYHRIVGEYLSEQTKQWWEGLGKELEVDIETFTDSSGNSSSISSSNSSNVNPQGIHE